MFYIQTGNPSITNIYNSEDNKLFEAMESVFPLITESAFLVWNNICIPLSYKYDLSYMIDDILIILSLIQNQNEGKQLIHWLPDTFRCDWSVEWSNEKIKIESFWECTTGHLESMLNMCNTVTLLTSEFLYEWKGILKNIIDALDSCGYKEEQICNLKRLRDIYENIGGSGYLYQI